MEIKNIYNYRTNYNNIINRNNQVIIQKYNKKFKNYSPFKNYKNDFDFEVNNKQNLNNKKINIKKSNNELSNQMRDLIMNLNEINSIIDSIKINNNDNNINNNFNNIIENNNYKNYDYNYKSYENKKYNI